jgi:hypothetical protein
MELFGAEFDVLLGSDQHACGRWGEKNPMMGPRYSRDHRPDCEQMGRAHRQQRRPFSYATFDGNRADVPP